EETSNFWVLSEVEYLSAVLARRRDDPRAVRVHASTCVSICRSCGRTRRAIQVTEEFRLTGATGVSGAVDTNTQRILEALIQLSASSTKVRTVTDQAAVCLRSLVATLNAER